MHLPYIFFLMIIKEISYNKIRSFEMMYGESNNPLFNFFGFSFPDVNVCFSTDQSLHKRPTTARKPCQHFHHEYKAKEASFLQKTPPAK